MIHVHVYFFAELFYKDSSISLCFSVFQVDAFTQGLWNVYMKVREEGLTQVSECWFDVTVIYVVYWYMCI